MNIVRLNRAVPVSDFSNYSSFVYTASPAAYILAPYWTKTFKTGEKNNNRRLYLTAFAGTQEGYYTNVASVSLCQSTEKSWFWDNDDQILYIHFEHNQNPFTDTYIYNYTQGFCDGDSVLYIDDIEYLPIIDSVPDLSQQASIIDYDKQAYLTGAIKLKNSSLLKGEDGPLDFLIKDNIYRNTIDLLFLDEEDIIKDEISMSAQGSDLVPLGSFYSEKPSFTLYDVTISIQDKRKISDFKVPTSFFNSTDYPSMDTDRLGDIIPVAYGQIREIPCIPIENEYSGNPTFKAAESLTSLGTVYVEVDGVWTVKTPTATDIGSGEFTLASADCRDANDKLYSVKLYNAIGEVIVYASDVIKALNLKYLDVSYNSEEYDLTEWETEEIDLEPIGLLLNEQKNLSDWIYEIQNGANIGFRYEITPTGLRTIRLRRNNRPPSAVITYSIIANSEELPVEIDPDTVYASVKVSYAKSYQSGKSLSETDESFFDIVKYNYNTLKTLEVESFLTSASAAQSRGANDAEDFSVARPTSNITACGSDQLSYKIYQVVTVELSPGDVDLDNNTIVGREYFGIRDAIILGIAPNGKTKKNNLTLRIID